MDIRKRREQLEHRFALSVILPTYNRVDVLERMLHALEKQTLPKEEFEVIVVNDGSTDGTREFLDRYQARGKLHFTVIHKENEGQGIARNKGAELADGYILVFTQDDHIPDPHFLMEHKRFHEVYATHTFMCLGFTTWHPELTITPYMRFLEASGMQFRYGTLEKRKLIDPVMGLRMAGPSFFYAGNLSMKRLLFEKQQFDTRFRSYGWEDIELGTRLVRDEHAILLYHRQAKAFHFHPQDEEDFPAKMIQIGRSARLVQSIDPRVPAAPPWWKHLLFFLIANKMSLTFVEGCGRWMERRFPSEKPLPFHRYLRYYIRMKHYFLQGLAHDKKS